ncbi:hypothetical protein GGP51_002135 [Salinibacter ruber]|nr:hypothetical protein [Salinibacter ruber]MCS4183797.1 hypothetical protein [Salinibacter ruber]MCS4190652.1 hypothetical protein [Salinibacter ruber]
MAFLFACPEALPARFWHGAFLSPLTVAARKREPDRRAGARLGAQLRGVRGARAVASGCGAPDRFGDQPSSPCLLDAALEPSRRWRAAPVAARRASASAIFVFAIHAPTARQNTGPVLFGPARCVDVGPSPFRCDGPQLSARHRRPTSQTRKKCRGLKLTAPMPRAPVPPIICIGIRLNHTGLCRFSLSFPLSAPSRSPRVLRRTDSQDGSLSRHSRAAR